MDGEKTQEREIELAEERRGGVSDRREAVDHPAHYGGDTKYEVIKLIEAFGLGFCAGNALKYLLRAGKKDSSKELEDTGKAVWYLQRQMNNGENSVTYPDVDARITFDEIDQILLFHKVPERTALSRAVEHVVLGHPYAALREAAAWREHLETAAFARARDNEP